jgi:ELWxxDGT repeat protein
MSLNNPSRKDVASTSLSLDWYKQLFSRQPARKTRRQSSQSANESALVNLEARVLLSGTVEEVNGEVNEAVSSANWQSQTVLDDQLYYIANGRLGTYSTAQGAVTLNLKWQGQTISVGENANNRELGVAGTTLYFYGSINGTAGRSLFSLDENGVVSQVIASQPIQMTEVGTSLYFQSNGFIYKIDSAGSMSQIAQSGFEFAQDVDGRLYFQARINNQGYELWRESTSGGIEKVFDLYPGVGSFPANLTKVGDDLYFTDKNLLWRVNGEDNSVESVVSNTGLSIGSPQSLKASNGTLYFVGGADGLGHGVWKINEDGNAEFLATAQPPDYIGPVTVELAIVDDVVYFSADRGSLGKELWKIDSSGVHLVRDFMPGASHSNPARLTSYNGELLFLAQDQAGYSLWKMDSAGELKRVGPWADGNSTAGPFSFFEDKIITRLTNATFGGEIWAISLDGQYEMLTDSQSSPTGSVTAFVNFNSKAYYLTENGSLWTIDQYGLQVLVATNASSPVVSGTSLYFARTTSAEGTELWRVTSTGSIQIVADLITGSGSSNPSKLTDLNGILYFQTNDSLGIQLARVLADGTVQRLNGIQPYNIADDMPDKVGFVFNGDTYLRATNGNQNGLWKANGPGSLTFFSSISPTAIKEHNGNFYLVGSDGTTSSSLWKINNAGTVTRMANSANGQYFNTPASLTSLGQELFFVASTSATGRELFKINASGTGQLVHDVTAGTSSSSPVILGTSGSLLYYRVSATVRSVTNDGTITTVGSVLQGVSSASDYHLMNGSLYYMASSTAHGKELRRMDLTTGAVSLVIDMAPGTASSQVQYFTQLGNEIIFTAEDGLDVGKDVWRIDENGVASKIWNGEFQRDRFFEFGGSLYFSGNDIDPSEPIDSSTGNRLWKYSIPLANTSPVIADQQFTTPENSPAGTVVGQVVASDSDPGQYLRYEIVDGNYASAFAIDPRTGIITVANPAYLDFEFGLPIQLIVKVSDTSNVSASSTAAVTISTTNVNESPLIEFSIGGQVISEGSVIDAGIWQQYLTATNTTALIKNLGSLPITLVVNQVVGNLTVPTPTTVTIAPGASLSLSMNPLTRQVGTFVSQVQLRFESYSESSLFNFSVGYSVVANPELTLAPVDLPGAGNSFNSTTFNQVKVGDQIYILADNLREIWRLDADGSMTRFARPSTMSNITSIVESNGELYSLGIGYDGYKYVLHMASNGTFTQVGQFPTIFDQGSLFAAGGYFYLSANNNVQGQELWRMSMDGTSTVIDIYPGATGSSPARLVTVNDVLYLVANDGTNGRQIFRYTPEDGAVRLTNLSLSPGGLTISSTFSFNDELYFTTTAGSPSALRLWKIDSTDQLTLVRTFTSPTSRVFVAENQLVVYQAGNYPSILTQEAGESEWVEYSLSGTRITTINDVEIVGDRIFLLASHLTGGTGYYELQSSGPPALITTVPFVESQFFAWNDSFYSVGTYGTEGRELWITTPIASLSNDIIPKVSPANALVGEFVPFEGSSSFTYELVAGLGDNDNHLFVINGTELRVSDALDNLSVRSRQIRVRITDDLGNIVEKNFIINVNDPPTALTISNQTVPENASFSLVGIITVSDLNSDILSYSIVPIDGSTDDTAFMVFGSTLYTFTSLNFELKSSYTIRLRATDSFGAFFEKDLTISVTNVNETPTDIVLGNSTIQENLPPNTPVGNFTTTDPDAANTQTYTLVSGTGSTDNAAFTIVGNQLRTNASFDYETKSSYTIRVRTTDQGGLFFEKTFTILVSDVFEMPAGSTPLSNLRYGVAGSDHATGVGYMMYSQQNVRTRFSGLDSNNANNFINVRYDGGQWQYDNNLTWVNFTPTSTDVLVAAIDFTTDTVTLLKGNFGIVNGISMGYLDGDLLVTANQWNGQANAGEFGVSGRFISFATSTPLNNLRFGVAAIDNATGTGYMMYSQQSLQSRFPGINSTNASNFINVRNNSGQWQYDNNSTWVNFTPTSTDVLVAELDFTADTVTMLEGNLGVVNGIVQGYLDSDLTITANAYNGASNAGEYDLTGTYITFASRTSLTGLRNGVGGTDNATGTGYMMYSQQNVRTRFSGLDPNNADNFVNVRYLAGQWQYDNNSTWVNFTPTSSDRLVAALDFTADTVDLLKGTFSTIQGIASGYLDSDLTITPNNWNGNANTGEYHLTGTFITFMPTV